MHQPKSPHPPAHATAPHVLNLLRTFFSLSSAHSLGSSLGGNIDAQNILLEEMAHRVENLYNMQEDEEEEEEEDEQERLGNRRDKDDDEVDKLLSSLTNGVVQRDSPTMISPLPDATKAKIDAATSTVLRVAAVPWPRVPVGRRYLAFLPRRPICITSIVLSAVPNLSIGGNYAPYFEVVFLFVSLPPPKLQ